MAGRKYEEILGRDGVPTDYDPEIHPHFVKVIPSDTGLEHIRILSVPNELSSPIDGRRIDVATDTTVVLNEVIAQLQGEGLFLFNALMCAVRQHQTSAEIRNFRTGNHPRSISRATLNTRLLRAVHSLDAWAIQASDHPLIQRSSFGSGPSVTYALMDDVSVVDCRRK